jgi:hypothetical protein|tara:strand:- start:739 stop:999 length:261 start_codon:yes stop_codon:yes gene_type:complete
MFDKIELWEELESNECLLADGLNDAVVGISYGVEPKTVYSVHKIIEILMEDGMEWEEAIEHFSYNIGGAYVGEKTPIFIYDLDEQE